MPTKNQAKNAVDAAAVAMKADIDNTLPAGINITDGRITFNPTRWSIQLNAEGALATAQTIRDAILTALTAASRTFTVTQVLGRRDSDGAVRYARIQTALADYEITNF